MDYKSKLPDQFKVSELTELQRGHLAWRLDHKTICGYVTACHIGRGDGNWGEMTLGDVFIQAGDTSPRSSKIHARAVLKFDNYGTFVKK